MTDRIAGIESTLDQEQIIASILMERLRQADKWGGAEHDDMHTDLDWNCIFGKGRGDLERALLDRDEEAIDRELVQTFAVGVAWLEVRMRRRTNG